MKKILLISVLLSLFISKNVLSEIVILECKWDDSNTHRMTLHIDPVKQHLLQFDTAKYDPPQAAITSESAFSIIIEVNLSPENVIKEMLRYNDSGDYSVMMMLIEINRYSGRFDMHQQILNQNLFKNKFLEKIKTLRGKKNIYQEIYKFAKENNGPGYRWRDDLGPGTCIKSKQKF